MIGISLMFKNMLQIVGIIFLAFIGASLLACLKAIIEVGLLNREGRKLFKKMKELEKYATKTLKCFKNDDELEGIIRLGILTNDLKNFDEEFLKEKKEV